MECKRIGEMARSPRGPSWGWSWDDGRLDEQMEWLSCRGSFAGFLPCVKRGSALSGHIAGVGDGPDGPLQRILRDDGR